MITKQQDLLSLRTRAIMSSMVTNIAMWFSLSLWAFLPLQTIARLFSAQTQPSVQFMAIILLPFTFICVPIGLFIRKKMKAIIGHYLPLFFLCIITLIITFLPSINFFGSAICYLFVLLRLLQGVAIGLDNDVATKYFINTKPAGKGFPIGLLFFFKAVGIMTAVGSVYFLQKLFYTVNDSFIWKGTLVSSLLITGIALFFRRQFIRQLNSIEYKLSDDTNGKEEGGITVAEVKNFSVMAGGAFIILGVLWFTDFFYTYYFLVNRCGLIETQALSITICAFAIGIPLIVFFSWLSDRFHFGWAILVAFIICIITMKPIYTAILNQSDVSKITGNIPYMQGSPVVTKNAIGSNGDSIQIIMTKYKSLDEFSYKVIMKDTLFATGNKGRMLPQVIDKHLPKKTYWKMTGLFLFQIILLAVSMGGGWNFICTRFTSFPYSSIEKTYMAGFIGAGAISVLIDYTLTNYYQGNVFINTLGSFFLATLGAILLIVFWRRSIIKKD